MRISTVLEDARLMGTPVCRHAPLDPFAPGETMKSSALFNTDSLLKKTFMGILTPVSDFHHPLNSTSMTPAREADYPIGIGIDFGTSNSSIALFDGVEVEMIRLETADEAGAIMPTALYIDRRNAHSIGQSAIAAYLKGEAGRVVRLTKENTG